MQMHTAPRQLMLWGQVSDTLTPTRSVLAGCFWAIPFVRVLPRRALTMVAAQPGVHLTAYVDDVGQDIVGPLKDIAYPFLRAVHSFADAAQKLKLTLTGAIITTSKALTHHTVSSLADRGVHVKAESNVRDLGLTYTVGLRRTVKQLTARSNKVKKRLQKTKIWSTFAKQPENWSLQVQYHKVFGAQSPQAHPLPGLPGSEGVQLHVQVSMRHKDVPRWPTDWHMAQTRPSPSSTGP